MDATPQDQQALAGERGRILEAIRDWTDRFHALAMDVSNHWCQLDLPWHEGILTQGDELIVHGASDKRLVALQDRGEQLGKAASNLSCELSDKLLQVVEVVAPELAGALVTAGECFNGLRRPGGIVKVRDARKAVSELYLLLAQTPETLPGMAQARDPEPAEQAPPMASGSVGRPNFSRLCIEEFRQRAERGETLPSLTEEARFLRRWLQGAHPDKLVAVTTIENVIRSEYRDRE